MDRPQKTGIVAGLALFFVPCGALAAGEESATETR